MISGCTHIMEHISCLSISFSKIPTDVMRNNLILGSEISTTEKRQAYVCQDLLSWRQLHWSGRYRRASLIEKQQRLETHIVYLYTLGLRYYSIRVHLNGLSCFRRCVLCANSLEKLNWKWTVHALAFDRNAVSENNLIHRHSDKIILVF